MVLVIQSLIMLDLIDPYVLLGIGVVLIGLEAVITSFILIWFGLGFLITALISVLYVFPNGVWQLAVVGIISLLFIMMLRKKILKKFLASSENISDNFFDEKGFGEIKNQKVFYKGTYWEIDSSLDAKDFKEGEKVLVKKTFKNFAVIEKK